jgi:hypothetical protein
LLPTGSLSASIPGVTDYSDYTFNWFNINDSNSALAPDPSDPKRIINKPAGTYTVEVTYNLTGCTSSFSGFIEDNVQLGKPVFGLTPIHNADCKDSGEINIVGVTGSELDNYTFRWYKVPYNPANPFHSGTELSRTGLSLGTYYVEAEDITYGCTTIIQTELIDESTAPEIQFDFDAAVQAQCLPGILTGQVIANVDGIYGASLNSLFDFTWYYGSSTTVESNRMIGEKDYFISQLDSGYYSVIIKNLITECTSEGTYYVRDGRPYPNINVEIIANKNCDLSRPNGEIYAKADGDIENHSFEWYVGEFYDLDEINPLSKIGDLADIGQLSAQWYTVVVRNNFTQCRNLLPVLMMDSLELIPAPQALALAHVDNCAISNGVVTASVEGNTEDYIFNWYLNESSDEIVYTGITYEGIAPGIYNVTATEKATRCISEKASVEVEDHRIYP